MVKTVPMHPVIISGFRPILSIKPIAIKVPRILSVVRTHVPYWLVLSSKPAFLRRLVEYKVVFWNVRFGGGDFGFGAVEVVSSRFRSFFGDFGDFRSFSISCGRVPVKKVILGQFGHFRTFS